MGAVDHITKPFDVHELHLRVRNVLRRSGTEHLFHPTTGLPSPLVSDERLRELRTCADWAILSVGLQGLTAFSDIYGFVARDDVVRAVALALNHMMSERHDSRAFVGHLDGTNFFVITAATEVAQVQEALEKRLSETIAFFYPSADWEAQRTSSGAEWPRIKVVTGVLRPSTYSFGSLGDFRRAVYEAQRADWDLISEGQS